MGCKKRILSLDYLKCACLFLVVYTHFWNGGYKTLNGISLGSYFIDTVASLAVPIFFLINGYLLFQRNFDLKKHSKKILNILLCIIAWTTIYYIAFSLMQGNQISLVQLFKTIYTGKVDVIPTFNISNWFFYALLGIYLFFPLLKSAYDQNYKILTWFMWYIFIICFVSVTIFHMVDIVRFLLNGNTQFNHLTGLMGSRLYYLFVNGYSLGYFIVGGVLAKLESKKWMVMCTSFSRTFNLSNKSGLLLFVSIFALCLNYVWGLMITFNSTNIVDTMFNNVWNGYPSLSVFVASVGLFCYILIKMRHNDFSERKAYQRLAIVISNNSMGIYFVHLLIGNIVNNYFIKMNSFCLSLPYVLVIFVLSCTVSFMISRVPMINRIIKM